MKISNKFEVGQKAGNGEGMSAGQMQRACPGNDHRETADGYRGVLLDLGRYRVAVCRDGIQWLYQRRRPGAAGGGTAWDTLGHCRARETLIRLHRSYSGSEAPEMATLPERFKREGGQ